MDDDTQKLFEALHNHIMHSAKLWATNKGDPDYYQGEVMGAIGAWFVAAIHFNLDGHNGIYEEYKAMILGPK